MKVLLRVFATALLFLAVATSLNAQCTWQNDANNNISNCNTGGKVGIGAAPSTTAGAPKVQVVGAGSNNIDLSVTGRIQTGDAGARGGIWLDGDAHTMFIGQTADTTPYLGFFLGTSFRFLMNKNTGAIGVNTYPQRLFDLTSDVYGFSFETNSGSGTSGAIRFGDNSGWKAYIGRSKEVPNGALNSGPSGAIMTFEDRGRVAIGTTDTSQAIFTVLGNSLLKSGAGYAHFSSDAGNTMLWQNIRPSAGKAGFLSFTEDNVADRWIIGTKAADDRLYFISGGLTSTNTPALVLNYAGNVAMGQASPGAGYRLDVNGNTNITGNLTLTGNVTAVGSINAKYQDVAELVPSVQSLAAGTVVILDPQNIKHVLASEHSYDTAVAGVISAQPGITLGEGGADKVKVATTGRVKVKVDASNGPIHVGDLLVTSDKAGVAMKSTPVDLGSVKIHRPGTIIGKAIEPLADGQGEILVLLSLQ